MQTIFTTEELKENYQILIRLLQQLQADSANIKEALSTLEKIPNNAIPGDIASQAKATAIAEVVKQREQTSLKLLEVYKNMYEDLRSVIFQLPSDSTAE